MNELPFLIAIPLSGFLSVVILKLTKKIVKRNFLVVPIWLFFGIPIMSLSVNITAPLWHCNGDAGCVVVAVGLALLLIILTSLSYLISGIVSIIFFKSLKTHKQ
ncbi:MAG: hypothetical protein GOU98_05050 [Candidatus Altiarchaeota archaeon]|nr:hypothetical protein [Candidatus Altiarchaeota archaeon]